MKGQRNQVKSNNESNAGAYLKSILRETFRSITRNSLMSAASVLSILSALLILGIFIVFSVNVEHLTNSVAQSLELKVYLTNGLTQEQITELMDLAVMDLSFISVKLILPAIFPLLKDDAQVVCLIKPQFEAGREEVGKKGVVRDPKVHLSVLESFLGFLPSAGYSAVGLDFSPIKGPEGNIEYLGYLKKGLHESDLPDPAEIVRRSHENLETIR